MQPRRRPLPPPSAAHGPTEMTLRRFALALTALVCANAYLLHPLGGTTLPSRTSQLSRAAVVLKKGRAQGGTPKISLRRKKIYTARSKTDGLKQVSQRPKRGNTHTHAHTEKRDKKPSR